MVCTYLTLNLLRLVLTYSLVDVSRTTEELTGNVSAYIHNEITNTHTTFVLSR